MVMDGRCWKRVGMNDVGKHVNLSTHISECGIWKMAPGIDLQASYTKRAWSGLSSICGHGPVLDNQ